MSRAIHAPHQADAPNTAGAAGPATDPDSTADGSDRSRVALASTEADQEALRAALDGAKTIAEFVRVLLDNHIDFRFQIGEYPRPHPWSDITDYLIVREMLERSE